MSSPKFYEYYSTHFSTEANWQMRTAYLIMVILIFLYTIVVAIEGLCGGTCRYAQNRDSFIDDDLFVNPEFSTFGGCLRTRFWFLIFLTPEECMLCRRILLSVMLGMMIGFERRRADRPAGVRTMSLVSLGSCVFTIDSMFAFSSSPDAWDSSRVAAAIPSGVGFLGAGLIYKQSPRTPEEHHEVHGLTTASSVWLSAAAGIAAGGGLAVIAFFSTCTMLIVLRFGPRLPPDISRFNSSGVGSSEHSVHEDYEEEMRQYASSAANTSQKVSDLDIAERGAQEDNATIPAPSSESAPLVRPSPGASSDSTSAFKKRASASGGGYYSAVATDPSPRPSTASERRAKFSSKKQPSLRE